MSNDQVIENSGVEDIAETLRRERARLLGHILRSPQQDIMASTALDAAVKPRPLTGKRRRGAPRVHWVQLASTEAFQRLPQNAHTRTGARKLVTEEELLTGRASPAAETPSAHSLNGGVSQDPFGFDTELMDQFDIEEAQGFHRGTPSQSSSRSHRSPSPQPVLPPATQASPPTEPQATPQLPSPQPTQPAEGALGWVSQRELEVPFPLSPPVETQTQRWVLELPGNLLILRELAQSRPLWHRLLTEKAAHGHILHQQLASGR